MKRKLWQRLFVQVSAIGILGLFIGCSEESESQVQAPNTTINETIVPLVSAEPQSSDDRSEWGLTAIGPGEPHTRRTDLGLPPTAEAQSETPSSLAFFWHLTDIHVSDEESPARLVHADDFVSTAYRNQEAWSSFVLDAAFRTGNAFSQAYPFDFVLLTGDLVENIHRNEITWFMGIIEGGTVDPDSGDDDDPLPDSDLDPHSPFEAEGLDPDLPWYVALGNHDKMIMGWLGEDDSNQVADPTGDTTKGMSAAVIPTCLAAPFFETEPANPSRCYMPPNSYFTDLNMVPDPDREFLRGEEFLSFFFDTQSIPDGHGLTQKNIDEGHTYYAAEGILPHVPSTLVVLDTTNYVDDGGMIDTPQLEWLETALTEAEEKGHIIIVASHHPAWAIDENQEALIATLHDHPNVVLHIAGHTHNNRITPRPAPDGLALEHGYWEIQTSSLIDWPQQTRLIEIVDNWDGTGSIYATMLNYQIPMDMPVVEGGRYYSLYDVQEGNGELGTEGDPQDRNANLVFTWPQDIAAALKELPNRPVVSTQLENEVEEE